MTLDGGEGADPVLERLSFAVFQPLSFLRSLASETGIDEDPKTFLDPVDRRRFFDQFALGRKGLHGVCDLLDDIYRYITSRSANAELYQQFVIEADRICGACIHLVDSFCSRVPCQQWYPLGPMRAFAAECDAASKYLPVR